jgi:hypothetical protein
MSQTKCQTFVVALVIVFIAAFAHAGDIPRISDLSITTFAPWSKPIEDYRTFAETCSDGERSLGDIYFKSIHDLAPFEDKMWFGYGDANNNLASAMMGYGYRGIEFRYFDSPDNPLPHTTLESGEEHIDHFRILDGVLWAPGLDGNNKDDVSAQPGIRGNVYRLEDEQWLKFREINGGVHVHDIAIWKKGVFVVGSGTYDLTEWGEGNIYRYLWKSTTNGKSFNTVRRIVHPVLGGVGDTRWLRLLSLENVLYIFGYYSIFEEEKIFPTHARYEGTDVIPLDEENPDELMNIFCRGTEPLPDGTGLMWGIVDSQDDGPGMKWGSEARKNAEHKALWHLDINGKPTQLKALDGKNIIDIYHSPETEELIYLLRTDDEETTPPAYTATILVASRDNPGKVKELLTFTSEVKQISIAYWKGAMFLGMDDCGVWKGESESIVR